MSYPAEVIEPLPTIRKLNVLNLGLRSYTEVWNLQREIQSRLIRSEGTDTLILCQHFPVITLGRGSAEENVLLTPQELAKRRIEILHIERGGDVTFHGPGQLVVYPIINLKNQRQDVHWYMRSLEEVIIGTLAVFGVNSFRVSGRTGVWTLSPRKDYTLGAREGSEVGPASGASEVHDKAKIASLGVRISRWCTMHGAAVNVLNCQAGFELINPCGMKNVRMTSLEELNSGADMTGAAKVFEAHFRQVFGY